MNRQLELHGERDLTPATGLPRVPRAYVPRPRLHRMLDEAVERAPVVLLVAPAVSGKSTLLAGWQATDASPPMAYVALDAFDDHVVPFWTKVIDSLQSLHPGCGEAARVVLGSRDTRRLLDVLLPDLAGLPPTVLVLDGLEALTQPTALAMLGGLLFGVAPPFRVLLSSRTEPPLRFGLLRARGQLAEIHARHLAFTRPEMAEVLELTGTADHPGGPDGHGDSLGLGPDEQLILHTRTEGWVGGVRLAALALRDHPDPSGFVHSFTGHNRYLAELLDTEVLAPQPPAVRDFLLSTSVLGTLDDGLCDAVTSGSGSAALLDRLERSGLFLDAVDDERERYRYRPLFREFLRHELHVLDPAREQGAHRAAAAEHERRGEITPAVEHYVAGGRTEAALGLVVEHGERYAGIGQVDVLRRWLAALPDHAVAHDTEQMLAVAGLCLMAGMREEGAMWLERSRLRVDATDDDMLIAQHALLTAFAAAQLGNLEGAIDHAERVLVIAEHARQASPASHGWVEGNGAGGNGHHPTGEHRASNGQPPANGHRPDAAVRLRDKAHHLLAAAYAGLDQFDAARRHRDAAPHDDSGEVPTDAYSAWLCYREGHLEQATGHANRLLANNGLPWQWTLPLVARGGVLRERNHLDAAAMDLTRAMELSEDWWRPRVFVHAAIELAQLRFAEGCTADAFDLLTEAAPRAHGVDLRQRVDVADAALWLRAGDLDRATVLRRELPTSRLTAVLDIRLRLARGEIERARQQIDALEAGARSLQERITARLLRARVLLSDDEPGAVSELQRAVELGRWEGFVQLFTEDLLELDGLLRAWVGEGDDPYAFSLLAAVADRSFRPEPPNGSVGVRLASVETLSTREQVVLRYLATSLANKEIAGHLHMSVNTLKTHLKSIYRKLGAGTRQDAVSSARQQRLL